MRFEVIKPDGTTDEVLTKRVNEMPEAQALIQAIEDDFWQDLWYGFSDDRLGTIIRTVYCRD